MVHHTVRMLHLRCIPVKNWELLLSLEGLTARKEPRKRLEGRRPESRSGRSQAVLSRALDPLPHLKGRSVTAEERQGRLAAAARQCFLVLSIRCLSS